MRKIFYSIILLGSTVFAQEKQAYLSISGGFDIRNAIIGSQPTDNKPALDWVTQFDCVGANTHVIIGYESFKAIDYSRMYAGLGYEFPLYAYIGHSEIKTAFIPSVDVSIIQRTLTESYTYEGKSYSEVVKPGFMAFGINLAFQWDLTDNIGMRFNTKIGQRPDIKYIYGTDKTEIANYFSIIYKFNQN